MPNFDKARFFDVCRAGVMGPTLDQGEVSGAEAVLGAVEGLPIAWAAYALATAWHETAHTMQPIKELGGERYFFRMYDIAGQRPKLARENGNIHPGDGCRFCGRGYVQLTWRANYARAGKALGVDLEGNPDLAMRPDIAAKILRWGMTKGAFTGIALTDRLPAVGGAGARQFIDARWIINRSDKAEVIAGYALDFQAALKVGGWA